MAFCALLRKQERYSDSELFSQGTRNSGHGAMSACLKDMHKIHFTK